MRMMKKQMTLKHKKNTQEETHQGKSQKTHPKLTKEKVNKSKLGDKLVKDTRPNNQRKAKNKTKNTTQQSKVKKT